MSDTTAGIVEQMGDGERSLIRQDIDPSMAHVFEMLPNLTVTDESLPEVRRMMEMIAAISGTDGAETTEHTLDDGIILRVVGEASAVAPRPCVYAIHGGGLVLGTRKTDDLRLGRWSKQLGVLGVSVEYRLAPEHPYPAALDDCTRGLEWVFDHADELGVDPERIGVFGLSAGGGLSAALTQRWRDEGRPPLAFQLLDSPMLDDRQRTPSSRATDLPVWNHESNRFGWDAYLGDLAGSDDVPPHAAPARATDLSGLPPAFVMVGSVDGFRDEDVDYATRLNQAGVPTELHVYPGGPHGFTAFPGIPLADQADADAQRWLARVLEISPDA